MFYRRCPSVDVSMRMSDIYANSSEIRIGSMCSETELSQPFATLEERAQENRLSQPDFPRPVVLKQLRALSGEGLIEWLGKSPKDPRAYWKVRCRSSVD